ncbi:hypothetical protein Bpfe_031140 [Biomphalaria pfeifferi]|uniref:Uncharacterized protein n=1 Tax=Biomphalaria pfeifferi TaxID=112525 RepID=A0AAD8ANM2_BIOPF|nr:hypothetical protein Bpfe_031140 [Biomphalaria pfeifferi]
MTQDEAIGAVAMYGGSVTSCTSAAAWYWDESMIVMTISIVSVLVAIAGLGFTIWDRNRQYKLAIKMMQEERADKRQSLGLPPLDMEGGAA